MIQHTLRQTDHRPAGRGDRGRAFCIAGVVACVIAGALFSKGCGNREKSRYIHSVHAWHAERIERLQAAEGVAVQAASTPSWPEILATDRDAAPTILQFGTVSFYVIERGGVSHRLIPIGEPGQPLLVIFNDRTSGVSTYGGGRYLFADAPGPDGVVVLDFNRAYNPPCVFTPFATCPLPPIENRLQIAVTAGEKAWPTVH